MTRAPSLDEIFAVMSAASVGDVHARVVIPDESPRDDTATKLGVALNALLDGVALRGSESQGARDTDERGRSDAQLRGFVEASPDALVIVRTDGRIAFVNAQTEALFGYARDELIARPVEMLVPERFKGKHPAQGAGYFANPKARAMRSGLNLYGRRKDGSEFPVEISLSPVQTGEGVLVSSAIRDISDRKTAEQIERARQVATARLERNLAERTRSDEARGAALDEKTAMLQEIHHRVKNNLQVVLSLLNLQARKIHDEGTKAVFVDAQGRIRAIALLHESLYQSSDLGRIDMQAYFAKVAATLERAYGGDRRPARITATVEGVSLPVDKAVPCGLIVNELITNALKHAFRTSRDPALNEIRVALHRQGGQMVLSVEDNGGGFPDEQDPGSDETLGVSIVHDLSAQLGGAAAFSNCDGARCTVRFPVPAADPE